MPRCIYCLEDKDESAFSGREHVVQEAFGVFGTNNLVLKCVCDACNGYFGKEVDPKLTRDSAEAIDRVSAGLKPASEFKSLGKRSTSHVEFQEGPVAGGTGYTVANRVGGDTLGVVPFPLEIEDPFALLESKGFKLAGAETGRIEQPEGLVRIENVTRIAEPEFRAVTKIALNYLAAVVGSEVALNPVFDDARNFARDGKARGRVRVYPFENTWFRGRNGHYVSLCRWEDMIVAQLSILMRTQYFVVLAEQATAVPFTSTAHLFDREANCLKEMEPLALIPGWRLKPLKT